jgi:hypothetical protein
MQFRIQGKKIQCIRSTYDPTSKRNHQKLICSFERWADRLPSVGLEGLTDTERQELSTWFNARQTASAERANQYRVMSAASSLAQLGSSISATGAAMTESEAAATWSALADVAKALRKAGHPKPKRERERPASVVSGQADLLAEAVEPAPTALPPASTGV